MRIPKIEKGVPGYLNEKRRTEIIKTLLSFGLVAVILITGIIQTGDRLNMLTILAVLGCLPASRLLVGVISRFPHNSLSEEKVAEIKVRTEHVTPIYDLLITSREKIMPVACIVIAGHTVLGYTESKKVDLEYAAKYIKRTLSESRLNQLSVKVINNYATFLTRLEDLNNAAPEGAETRDAEELVKQVILTLSM